MYMGRGTGAALTAVKYCQCYQSSQSNNSMILQCLPLTVGGTTPPPRHHEFFCTVSVFEIYLLVVQWYTILGADM